MGSADRKGVLSQKGRITVGATLTALGASVIGLVLAQAFQIGDATSAASLPRAPQPVLSTTLPPTTTTLAPTTTTVAPKPKPAPPTTTTLVPASNGALGTPVPVPRGRSRTLQPIGTISIPAIGLHAVVREGIEQNVIDAGPAHWPGSAPLGGYGNVVLAGHRSSHTQPFHDAANLRAGDRIVIRAGGVDYSYAVTALQVVPNTALWITRQTPGRTLTIFTCHPIGSSRQRLVVHATLVATARVA